MKIKSSYQFLPVNSIRIDKYQRPWTPADTAWVKEKSECFDETQLGTITASLRNGSYFAIDGQHRIMLCKNVKREGIMALVYEGLTYEQEADYFTKLNGAHGEIKHLRKTEIFNAEIESKNEAAMCINAIASKYGFRITAASCDNSICAIGSVEKIYKKYGSSVLDEVLWLIKETWNGDRYSLNNQVLEGVAEFLNIYRCDDCFNNKTFAKQLSVVAPIKVVRESKCDLTTNKQAVKMMNTLLKYYNARLRNKMPNRHFAL